YRTAPDRGVVPVSRPIEDQGQGRPGLTVLGDARGGVGVVVLDADRVGLLLERPAGGEVVRVEVVGDQLRAHPEHLEVELQVGSEGAVGGVGVEGGNVGGGGK